MQEINIETYLKKKKKLKELTEGYIQEHDERRKEQTERISKKLPSGKKTIIHVYNMKMVKKTLNYDKVKINKRKFHASKNPVILN